MDELEMIKDMCPDYGTMCDKCNANGQCSIEYTVKRLINKNYRKIADDEIVIKKDEYETLKAQNDTLELYNKDLKYANTQLGNANKLFAKRNDELLDELQGAIAIKEKTVRAILQEAKERIVHIPQHHFTLLEVEWHIDNLAQKHGIELE